MGIDPTNFFSLKISDFFLIISLNGILTALISWWIKARIEQSIRHKYDKKLADYNLDINRKLEDHKLGVNQRLENYKLLLNTRLEDHKLSVNKKLEEYKFEIRKREQAAKVVELFSRLRSSPREKSAENADALAEINRMAWELSLWLPAEVVRGLASTLQGVQGSKDTKQILIDIRKVLLGNNDDLKAEEIVHFE